MKGRETAIVPGGIINSPALACRSPDRQRPLSSPSPPSPRVPSPACEDTPPAQATSPERPMSFDDDGDELSIGLPHCPTRLLRAEEGEERGLLNSEPNDSRDYQSDAYLANPMRFEGRNAEYFGDFVSFDANPDFNQDGPDERNDDNTNLGAASTTTALNSSYQAKTPSLKSRMPGPTQMT
ncbi:hypothetical protein FRC09_007934 [Ceratobasidium sp. 395]|nr:hypothetical protein FRC09_007934 [Ceratobasidium sp. 395]